MQHKLTKTLRRITAGGLLVLGLAGMSDGQTREFWAPLQDGYVREVDTRHPRHTRPSGLPKVGVGVGRATEQKPGLRMAGAPSLMAVAVHRLLFARFRSH
jgi:hypothetical protein